MQRPTLAGSVAKLRKPTKKNQSVAKLLQIIEVMASADGPMRLQDIGKTVHLPASTVLRFLKSLIDQDYVQQNPETLQYFLTFRLCLVADRVKQQLHFRDVVRAHLVAFSRKVGEAASLAVESEMQVVYVDVIEGPDHILQTLQRIGKIAPVHSTAVGKALMLDFSLAQIEGVIAVRGLPKNTDHTIDSKDALVRELGATRERGFAIDDEECETGVRCVAAPLRDYTGKIIAAISVSGPIHRMRLDRISTIGSDIRDLAATISTQLGYAPARNN